MSVNPFDLAVGEAALDLEVGEAALDLAIGGAALDLAVGEADGVRTSVVFPTRCVFIARLRLCWDDVGLMLDDKYNLRVG